MKKIIIILTSFLFIGQILPQDQFTEQTTIALTGINYGSVAWGDYDNDGDLDILLSGYTGGTSVISKIYRNNGDSTFTEQTSIALTGVSDASVAWGDYDNDGDLDILLTGSTSTGGISKIYRNNGDNTFTEQTSIALTGVFSGSAKWGDYDNDGDLDILLTGDSDTDAISKIYRNNGDNTFTEQTSIVLTGVYWSSAAWGDYDNDGDLDILLSGYTGTDYISKIYRNNGDNTFTEQTSIALTGVQNSSVTWGDYDNDGDLDILLTGWTGSSRVSKIYRNNGDNTFTEQTSIALTGVDWSSAAWGDYDNDGDLDILLTGYTGSERISKIYRNNADNTFTEQTSIALTGVYRGSVAWGDYDNDGDLDILLTGYTGSERISKIYRNNNITSNTLPVSPSNLSSVVNGQEVTLSWDKSTDNETPQNGLRYNLVIGTTPDAVNTLSPMSDRGTGYRRVINLGNTNHNNSWTIKGLVGQTYYWSVQALDNCFAGSAFSQGQNFIVIGQFTEQTSIALTGVQNSSVTWGDYDNDGDLDILLTGWTGSSQVSKIYRNNGDNTFTEQTSIVLTGVEYSSAAWGDYDNDGDLDILLTGSTSTGGISKIYRNNGDSTFTEQTSIALTGVYYGSVAWGDYDNDGDLDILLIGDTGTGYISKIYSNNGDNTFTEQTSIALTGVYVSSVAWGDYDNDGDLDILLTGLSNSGPVSKIYRNNGDSTFTEQTSIALTGVYVSSVAWGDYDNDGDLDILLTGLSNSGSISKIYRNNGDNTFTEQTSIVLTGVRFSSAAWGDYDNDGDLDILLTGYASTDYISKIYRNNGDNTFTEQTSIALTGVYYGSVAWGDYDNDGDLDILLTGYTGLGIGISKIYRNNNITSNTLPAVPSNLTAIVTADSVTLSWDKSTDNETPQNGLRYNLVIGRTPGAVNTLSPMSDRATGYRRVIELGNTNHNNSWTIKGLDSAQTYYWSVQVLDNCFAGSNFSQEQNFTNIVEQFTEQTSIILTGVDSSSVAWGDYDNDGDLDILLTGWTGSSRVSKIYHNNGDNTFIETSIALTGVALSSVEWGDYDNDGDLDILLTGYTGSSRVSKIYRNNGDNTFTEQTSIALTGVNYSSAAWGDYDNDGDLDILLAGYPGASVISKIYRNNGNNTFTEQTSISLTGVSDASVVWGDYDNDGDLDILLAGFTGASVISKIYRNNGNNTFTEQTLISLTGVRYGSAAWGDYDNDGDLDILLTGWTGTGTEFISKIYRNNGDNTFTEQTSIALTGVQYSSAAWGDYDNDGDLDILLTGDTGTGYVSKIYGNNGDNTFTEQTSIALTGVYWSSVAWGDYDNDGDLDILLTGWTGSSRVSKIYRNNNITPNTLPVTPSNLTSVVTTDSVTLSWDKSTDNETPQNGLRYNLVIGTTPGAVNTLSPMSDRNTGYRRVINLGNTNHNNSWTVSNLGLDSGQTCYWSVQALDNCFAGSNFSQEQIFINIAPPQVFSLSPSFYDYGYAYVGNSSSDQTFTITNFGGGTLTITSGNISIVGGDADQFVLTDANVYPIELGNGQSASVDVKFSPTSAGAKTADLQIVDNTVDGTYNAPLNGYAAPLPFIENYDGLTAGQQLACQDPVNWDTWSNSPCGNDDPLISSNYAHSGTNSVLIDYVSPRWVDLIKHHGNCTSGKWEISFYIYIPTGKVGYFNTLSAFDPSVPYLPNTYWAMEVYFNAGGSGSLLTEGTVFTPFTWVENTWQLVKVVADLDSDVGEFWFDGTMIHTWTWTSGASGGTGPLQLAASDIWAPDDITPANNEMYIDDYQIQQSSTATFQLSVDLGDGWNLVSVPGTNPAGMLVGDWWTNLTGTVFLYNGIQYIGAGTAVPGVGYWMNNTLTETYSYPAIGIVPHDPIPVTINWNIIGGYETSPTITALKAANSQISGTVFGYNGVQYVPATNLVPGYGYWVFVTTTDPIVIPTALTKGSGEVVELFKEDWGRITLTDAEGKSYTLYAVKGEVDLDEYRMPPLPPAGSFDIRFSSGRIAEDINSSMQSIDLTGVTYPLTVRVEGMDIRLQDESGKTVNVSLKSGEDVVIGDATIQKLKVSAELIPTVYALEQNYPNPFNPSTVIEFSLPEDVGNVKLSIYNALGEKVAELVNTSLVAGNYQYQWNAKNVATGMYIYELRADKFVSVKKMVLIK